MEQQQVARLFRVAANGSLNEGGGSELSRKQLDFVSL